MAYHPANLALRFLLEMVAIAIYAAWGWAWGGWLGWAMAVVAVIVAGGVWGIFRTPGDKSAKASESIVAVPGPVRLAIEALFFGLAVVILLTIETDRSVELWAIGFAIVVVVHYALSWDRVHWLLTAR